MKSKIYFIRHGITQGNLEGWHYGKLDVPLAPEGVEGIKERIKAGAYPDGTNAICYTSGLKRAEETFRLIYGDKPRTIVPEFEEFNFGEFEGKTYSEISEKPSYKAWQEDETGDARIPGGESNNDFGLRLERACTFVKKEQALVFQESAGQEEEVVSIIVCHGGVIGSVFSSLFPHEDKPFYKWIPEPGYGYLLISQDGKPVGYEAF